MLRVEASGLAFPDERDGSRSSRCYKRLQTGLLTRFDVTDSRPFHGSRNHLKAGYLLRLRCFSYILYGLVSETSLWRVDHADECS